MDEYMDGMLEGSASAGTADAIDVQDGAYAAYEAGDREQQTLRLKYNGEEMDLPVDEVVTLAQKGMNYDKVYARAQAAQDTREVRMIAQMAEVSGMEPEEYLDKLEEQRFGDMLGGMASGEAEELPADADRELEGFVEFVRKYPDIDELPAEAAALVRRGVPPLYAYEAYENARLRAGIAAREADWKNRENTPGSAGSLGETADSDPFLTGFRYE